MHDSVSGKTRHALARLLAARICLETSTLHIFHGHEESAASLHAYA